MSKEHDNTTTAVPTQPVELDGQALGLAVGGATHSTLSSSPLAKVAAEEKSKAGFGGREQESKATGIGRANSTPS